jgi:Uma2 family endonuclease
MATITPMRLGLADRGRVLSLREYLDAETEDGFRYELARGVLEVTQVPGEFPHGLIVYFLTRALARYDEQNPGAILRFGGAGEYHLSLPGRISGRNPDLAVTTRGTPRNVSGVRPPKLVFEVVSRGRRARRRDYETKREEYLAYGVEEYWIVDPEARRVTVLLRDGDAWEERIFADGRRAEGLVLPGFGVEVAAIWPSPETDDADAPPTPEIAEPDPDAADRDPA